MSWLSSIFGNKEEDNKHIIHNISNFTKVLGDLLNEWKTGSLKNVDHLKNIASIQVIEDLAKSLKMLDNNKYVQENLMAIRKKGLEKYINELNKLQRRVETTLAAQVLKQEDFSNEKIVDGSIDILQGKVRSLKSSLRGFQLKIVQNAKSHGNNLLVKRNKEKFQEELERFKAVKILSFDAKNINGISSFGQNGEQQMETDFTKMEEFKLFYNLKEKFSERTEQLVSTYVDAFSDILEKFERKKLRTIIDGYVKMRQSVNKLQYSETKLASANLLVPFTWLKNIFLNMENYQDIALDKLINKHESYKITYTSTIVKEKQKIKPPLKFFHKKNTNSNTNFHKNLVYLKKFFGIIIY